MQFKMIDVAQKQPTYRRAIAGGRIWMAEETLRRIQSGTVPKGNVLGLAEVAGIMAAKKTSDLLPLCHPIEITSVSLSFSEDIKGPWIGVQCEVCAYAKTGVEMEALTGTMAALLSIYDLTKGIDGSLKIGEIELKLKEGGKSSRKSGDWSSLRCGVITISDRSHSGEYSDRSGPVIVDFFKERGSEVPFTAIVPDEIATIQISIRRATQIPGVNLVVTTGGTGLSPRDQTPEAVQALMSRGVPGLGELLRTRGSALNPASWLSRSQAGVVDDVLVLPLPGSPKAVAESLHILEPVLLHAVQMLKGADHRAN